MKKISKLVAIILIILISVNMTISYAKSSSNTKFFTVNKTEIAPKETLEMTLNLSKINYKEFTFILSSNVSIKDINLQENVKNNVNSSKNNISIEINKDSMDLSKITLYYDIPENMKVGEKITLDAQILASIDTSDTKSENITAKNETKENITNEVTTSSTKQVVQELKIEVTIVEQNSNTNKVENSEENKNAGSTPDQNNTNKNEMTNENNQKSDKSGSEEMTQNNSSKDNSSRVNTNASTKAKTTSTVSTTQANQTETAVYSGSNNNYLSNIEIEGIALNTTFNKENQTYFAESNGLTNVNITATKEDANAKVYITGKDSLKTGTNKILISVTAQNGDVRYYRIFLENK